MRPVREDVHSGSAADAVSARPAAGGGAPGVRRLGRQPSPPWPRALGRQSSRSASEAKAAIACSSVTSLTALPKHCFCLSVQPWKVSWSGSKARPCSRMNLAWHEPISATALRYCSVEGHGDARQTEAFGATEQVGTSFSAARSTGSFAVCSTGSCCVQNEPSQTYSVFSTKAPVATRHPVMAFV